MFQSTLPAWGATRRRRCCIQRCHCFNPRSPRGERHQFRDATSRADRFQSTLPAWGATSSRKSDFLRQLSFNPRSPRGERRKAVERSGRRQTVSIHAPRVGSDNLRQLDSCNSGVSIHAPRVGSDRDGSAVRGWQVGFNPRSPRGERPARAEGHNNSDAVQSTLPAWGATSMLRTLAWLHFCFNPRSPRGERRQSSRNKG